MPQREKRSSTPKKKTVLSSVSDDKGPWSRQQSIKRCSGPSILSSEERWTGPKPTLIHPRNVMIANALDNRNYRLQPLTHVQSEDGCENGKVDQAHGNFHQTM